jgi:hypothetical protein
LQYYPETREMVGAVDGNIDAAYNYISDMMIGMGDSVSLLPIVPSKADAMPSGRLMFQQRGLRVIKGLSAEDRELILTCWRELWVGTIKSHQQLMMLKLVSKTDESLIWELSIVD